MRHQPDLGGLWMLPQRVNTVVYVCVIDRTDGNGALVQLLLETRRIHVEELVLHTMDNPANLVIILCDTNTNVPRVAECADGMEQLIYGKCSCLVDASSCLPIDGLRCLHTVNPTDTVIRGTDGIGEVVGLRLTYAFILNQGKDRFLESTSNVEGGPVEEVLDGQVSGGHTVLYSSRLHCVIVCNVYHGIEVHATADGTAGPVNGTRAKACHVGGVMGWVDGEVGGVPGDGVIDKEEEVEHGA